MKITFSISGSAVHNFSGIEALEFSCIYTHVYPATGEVFLVVANTCTRSI